MSVGKPTGWQALRGDLIVRPHRIENLHVRVTGPQIEGLPVSVRFRMVRKNDYGLIVFLDARGRAEISSRTLAQMFREAQDEFLMDYIGPRVGFTGRVTATVLDRESIDRALAAYGLYQSMLNYPADYAARLNRARDLVPGSRGRVRVRLMWRDRRPR